MGFKVCFQEITSNRLCNVSHTFYNSLQNESAREYLKSLCETYLHRTHFLQRIESDWSMELPDAANRSDPKVPILSVRWIVSWKSTKYGINNDAYKKMMTSFDESFFSFLSSPRDSYAFFFRYYLLTLHLKCSVWRYSRVMSAAP